LLHGRFPDLPLQSDTLDWVIMNGFLQSVGSAGATSSIRVQAEVLRRAFDLLRPGGHVAIGVENRWGLRALFGQRHVDRRNTHGLDAYQRLLARCGADEVRSFALLPHHRKPRVIIPVSPPCPPAAQALVIDQVWSRASPVAALGRRLLGLCMRAGIMRYVYPHYLLVGRKPC
jgi:SAM-dependent methyltransferase